MGRSPCCSKEGLNRGAWTAVEDKILVSYIKAYGEGKWRNLPKRAGLKRCGKSCRLRWLNYLRPDIKRGNISDDEEELIIRLHKLLGNRWSLIAGRLPGRTDNEIKNYWNTTLGKKLQEGQHCKPNPKAKSSKGKRPIFTPPPSVAVADKKPAETTVVVPTNASRCNINIVNYAFSPTNHKEKLSPRPSTTTQPFVVPETKYYYDENPLMVPGDEDPSDILGIMDLDIMEEDICATHSLRETYTGGDGVHHALTEKDKKDGNHSLSMLMTSNDVDDLLFNEALLEDWLGKITDSFDQPSGHDSHLQSLANSFLDLEEDWLQVGDVNN